MRLPFSNEGRSETFTPLLKTTVSIIPQKQSKPHLYGGSLILPFSSKLSQKHKFNWITPRTQTPRPSPSKARRSWTAAPCPSSCTGRDPTEQAGASPSLRQKHSSSDIQVGAGRIRLRRTPSLHKNLLSLSGAKAHFVETTPSLQ
jgi:hypothetical protein